MAQKAAILDRIQGAAMNRDAGQPDSITDVRHTTQDNCSGGGGWGGY